MCCQYIFSNRSLLLVSFDLHRSILQVLANLGEVHAVTGDRVKARFYLLSALALARALRAEAGESKCIASLGELRYERETGGLISRAPFIYDGLF